MYRLLIVDDEPDIVEGLSVYLKSAALPELDIYTAYSAQKALEYLLKIKIDIVITDIRMPGMSGMQLLDEIHRYWPACRVIFLTGYGEFDYVYRAIKFEGVSYLLKTEGNEEIVKAIEKAVEGIEKSLRIDGLMVQSAELTRKLNAQLQKEFLAGVLKGEYESADDIRRQAVELGIRFDIGREAYLLAGRVDGEFRGMSTVGQANAVNSIELIAESCFQAAFLCCMLRITRSRLILILQPVIPSGDAGAEAQRIAATVKGLAETLQQACKETVGISLSIVYDLEPCRWEEMPSKFEALRWNLGYIIGAGREMMIDRKATANERTAACDREKKRSELSAAYRQFQSLSGYLESGQKDEFMRTLDAAYRQIASCEDIGPYELSEFFLSVSVMLLSHINQWELGRQLAERENLGRLTDINACSSSADAMAYLLRVSALLFELKGKEEDDRAVSAVSKVKQYVADHLAEDLSIERLAETVFFNPQYLSRLFKRATGSTILGYINDMRLNRAKELLQDSRYKIHEVAGRVGFVSAPYFTHFFRRMCGIGPQEYRDNHFKRR